MLKGQEDARLHPALWSRGIRNADGDTMYRACMWKHRLPARKAGKSLQLLVLTLISMCVFSVWFSFLSRTFLGRYTFLLRVLARDRGVCSLRLGLFWFSSEVF